jgi:hypothetical protein
MPHEPLKIAYKLALQHQREIIARMTQTLVLYPHSPSTTWLKPTIETLVQLKEQADRSFETFLAELVKP